MQITSSEIVCYRREPRNTVVFVN